MGVVTWAQANFPRQRVFWAMSLGHLVNDTFMAMGSVMLVFLSTSVLPINLAQIGVAVSARQIAGAVSQPFFGIMGDRSGGRWLGAGGVAWTVIFQTLSVLMAFTGQIWLVIIPFVLAGLGSGAFHPVGASHATDADPLQQGRNASYFFLFGQFGAAVGPALCGLLLQSAKSVATPTASMLMPVYLLALVALPLTPFMLRSLPRREVYMEGAVARKAKRAANTLTWRDAALPLTLAALFVFLRTAAQQGSASFIPALLAQHGFDPAQYGFVTGMYWCASAVVGVLWGVLADRFGVRRMLIVSVLTGAPTLFLLPTVQTLGAAVIVAMFSGGLLSGTHALIVLFLQRLMPAGRGLATGIGLGGIFIAGALGSAFYGVLADGPGALASDAAVAATSTGIGLDAAFAVNGLIALSSVILLILIPSWAYHHAPSKPQPAKG